MAASRLQATAADSVTDALIRSALLGKLLFFFVLVSDAVFMSASCLMLLSFVLLRPSKWDCKQQRWDHVSSTRGNSTKHASSVAAEQQQQHLLTDDACALHCVGQNVVWVTA